MCVCAGVPLLYMPELDSWRMAAGGIHVQAAPILQKFANAGSASQRMFSVRSGDFCKSFSTCVLQIRVFHNPGWLCNGNWHCCCRSWTACLALTQMPQARSHPAWKVELSCAT